MMLDRIQLTDIEDYLLNCEVIINKAGRIVDGVNHGRTVHKGDGVYFIRIIVVEKTL